jgi:lipid II isoglutaminyl synthase (glutamine-hydrolysing)
MSSRSLAFKSDTARSQAVKAWLDRARVRLAVLSAHIIGGAIRRMRLGAGSVLPGEVAGHFKPGLLPLLCAQLTQGVILVVGTNGKTTTAYILRSILERRGWRIVHNVTGANLENGLVAALLEPTDSAGRLEADYAIFEVDENVLPQLVRQVPPRIVVCLNLFRDQLDRYGEVDAIGRRWAHALATLPRETTVILNADDPRLSYLGQQLPQRVLYFGLNEPERLRSEMPHAVDSVYCPRCGERLYYRGYYLSHLGEYQCDHCGFTRSPLSIDSRAWSPPLVGLYNKYNTLAAVLTARVTGVPPATIREAVEHFHAAFGRAEEFEINGRCVRILLSKNPAGMNETIRVLQAERGAGASSVALLVLNDRVPDGTDVSWIWDVDTEKLVAPGMTLVVSGDRAADMALRLQYSRPARSPAGELIVKEDLQEAVATALERTPPGELLHILPTYSAMLQVRQVLLGHPIL